MGRAATALEALGTHHLERRHRLVPEFAQLVRLQRSRVDAARLAILVHLLAGPK
jgi:hypothetical protein